MPILFICLIYTITGILFEEEKWRAQYGQVIESRKDLVLEFPVVDLWDWEMVRASKKDGKDRVARLVGRLVKQSAKRHPSISSVEKKFRSAPICEVHLNLVRVKTGLHFTLVFAYWYTSKTGYSYYEVT
jgi:hypothetical protein